MPAGRLHISDDCSVSDTYSREPRQLKRGTAQVRPQIPATHIGKVDDECEYCSLVGAPANLYASCEVTAPCCRAVDLRISISTVSRAPMPKDIFPRTTPEIGGRCGQFGLDIHEALSSSSVRVSANGDTICQGQAVDRQLGEVGERTDVRRASVATRSPDEVEDGINFAVRHRGARRVRSRCSSAALAMQSPPRPSNSP
jgi:hypothetical protein